jgi:hypothetical protein
MNYQELLTKYEFGDIPYEELLKSDEWRAIRKEIIERDLNKCTQCEATTELQVHHKLYFLYRLPWEYANKHLITLCMKCHHDLHEKVVIPFYNSEEEMIPLNYTPCGRCNGMGRIRKYSHVDNGICFKCGGKKYIELIEK